MESNILGILSEICFQVPEGYYERKEVKKQSFILSSLIEQLEKQLDDNGKKLLESVLDAQMEFDSYESYEYFCQGVCSGMQLYEEINKTDLKRLFKEKYNE